MPRGFSFAEANAAQRGLRRLAATRGGSWVAIRIAQKVDQPVFGLTGGRHTLTSLGTGLPVVFLTTTGAKSGEPRESPILGLPSRAGLVVIASNFGQARHPAWCHNLRAHPDAEVRVEGEMRRVRAREVEGDEREGIWREALEVYPGWGLYEQRAGERRIPVFVLDPA